MLLQFWCCSSSKYITKLITETPLQNALQILVNKYNNKNQYFKASGIERERERERENVGEETVLFSLYNQSDGFSPEWEIQLWLGRRGVLRAWYVSIPTISKGLTENDWKINEEVSSTDSGEFWFELIGFEGIPFAGNVDIEIPARINGSEDVLRWWRGRLGRRLVLL